jgi:hypothetical protein
MLQRPTRPLPRKFSRHASKTTRKFVQRRHERRQKYRKERIKRMVRRAERSFLSAAAFVRRWIWFACLGALLVTFGILLFSPALHLREIHVRRTDPRLDPQRIEQALRPMFGRHLFFLSSRDVQTLVQDAMPDASVVAVEKQYPSSIILTIQLHPLVARIVIDSPPEPVSASGAAVVKRAPTYDYLTDNGLYISLPSAASGGILPLIHIVDWAVRPIPSTLLIAPDMLKQMNDAELSLLQQFGFKTTMRTLFLRAREYHLQTPKFSLWFDRKSTLMEQLQRLRVFLKSVQPSDVHEYVDLRLTGRIVYK